MIDVLHGFGRRLIAAVRLPMAKAFAGTSSPLNYLGALTIFFLWIVLISGIWLFIFFRTSVSGAFESVEYLTREQWYLGGLMRSLHRYASDAAILIILFHVIKEFSFDRYRRNRWFTWVTGLPLVWMVFPLGITGYWLVWDELAQYVAISSAELLDSIPIFTDSMAGNFLSDDLVSDRFFTLMAFLHLIGLPIFLVFGIWLHVFRLNGPRINPPRRLMAGCLFAMLVLSAIYPAVSHEQANLAVTPTSLRLDWFYLHFYPLIQAWSPGWVWLLLIGISGLVMAAPWLPPKASTEVAKVSLEYCNGCRRCVDDCPFGAVEMVPRSDGLSYDEEARVDPDLCISCGICVGACPTATPFRSRGSLIPGIDLPERSVSQLREDIVAAAADCGSIDLEKIHVGQTDVMVFACRQDPRSAALVAAGERVVTVECMGQLPPSFVDYTLRRQGAAGVLLLGCEGGNCSYRYGAVWTEDRLTRRRDPMLRQRIDTAQIALAWQPPWSEYGPPGAILEAFRRSLKR